MIKLRFILFFLALISSVQYSLALPIYLPAPIDLPTGPISIAGPGGDHLPQFFNSISTDAPQISAASDITFPDETLLICGNNLEGSRLIAWAEGNLKEIIPFRSANNRLQAIIPKQLPISTMLIWPIKENKIGFPIRINGATTWWQWPSKIIANHPNQTIRIIGKNLKLSSASCIVYLNGPGISKMLTIESANPYHVEAKLPADLIAGNYKVWVHNGTGGPFGWSEPLSIEAKESRNGTIDTEFYVNNFGAKADDGLDDWHAINDAIRAAKNAGGGVVRFFSGTYHSSFPIIIDTPGIKLAGEGSGTYPNYDPESKAFSTTISYIPNNSFPNEIISIKSPHCRLTNLSVINGNDGRGQVAIRILSNDVVVESLNLKILDDRNIKDRSRKKPRIIDTGALYIDVRGVANITVKDLEIHTPGPGVQIGTKQKGHKEAGNPEPSTDYVLLKNITVRGYYAGEMFGQNYPLGSGRSTGVLIYNGKNIIVEESNFSSADRYNSRVLNRTCLVYNTSSRNLYLANNNSINVGSHSSVKGMHTNQGEQYLFHLFYPQGGLFNILDSTTKTTTISTKGIKPFKKSDKSGRRSINPDGSRVPDEVGQNDHWILFICKGKGVGQFRSIDSMNRNKNSATFGLSKPWRVVPDATSRVNLMAAYRNNIVYQNQVDTGIPSPDHKSHGVCFWYSSFNNIVANNSFKNLSAGVVFNSCYRNPTGWNLTRENTIQNISGNSGDTSARAAFYVDHYRVYGNRWPIPKNRVWYSIGNIARSNYCINGDVAAFLHARFLGKKERYWLEHYDSGIMMSVIENNKFNRVIDGIHLGAPANWAVIRNNWIQPIHSKSKPIVLEGTDFIFRPYISLYAFKNK